MSDGGPAIAVLGAQVLPDGRPSTALWRRARHAAELWTSCGRTGVIIACGGQGDGPRSEASVIAELLAGWGVDPGAVVVEDRSRSTRQQAAAVAGLVGAGGSVIVVTDRYHLPRALLLMRAHGVVATPDGVGRGGGRRRSWWLGALREIPAVAKDGLWVVGRRLAARR